MKSRFNIIYENVFIPADEDEVEQRAKDFKVAEEALNAKAKIEFESEYGTVEVGDTLRRRGYYGSDDREWNVQGVSSEGLVVRERYSNYPAVIESWKSLVMDAKELECWYMLEKPE